jgi:ubiquinone/menaquinone biosynthesis C-methylase UbiE
LFQLGYYWDAKIFLTSVKLDIYTALSEGKNSADELSASIKTDPAFTQRLLSALVVIGVITCDGERYLNTPMVSEFLVKTSPFYMGELMLLQDAEWDAWGNLEDIIRSGHPRVIGNLFMNRPDLSELTLNVLHRMGQRIAPSLAEKIDLSSYRSFLDVGGGAGTFSLAFCKRYPNLSSMLFDLPQTLPITRKNIEKEKMEDRITLLAGNFNNDPFPANLDVVFLSDILHYQTYAENQALFHKLYATTNPMGMIIVKDMFLGEDNAPGWNAIFSMHMMVYSQKGQCFKGSEITTWLEQAGFKAIHEIERNTVFVAKK